MSLRRVICAGVLVAANSIFAMAPSVAGAAPNEPFVLTGSFDASGMPNGSMESTGLVVNQATGHVLVVDKAHSAVLQFDESGNPVNFSGLGSPKLPLPQEGLISIDNSGTASQGDFFILHPGSSVEGFAPSGEKLPTWPVAATPNVGNLDVAAVDKAGHVWFSYVGGEPPLLEEHNAKGELTGKKIKGTTYTATPAEPLAATAMAFDSHDNLTYGVSDAPAFHIYRRDASEGYAPQHLYAATGGQIIRIDPATDDAWQSAGKSISGTRFTEPFEKIEPFESLPGLNVTGFDFSADGETLFESEGATVNIFKRQPPKLPSVPVPLSFLGVKSRGSFINAVVDTGGGAPATYAFEYATAAEFEETGEYGHSYPAGGASLPHTTFGPQEVTGLLDGLQPLTTYHVRIAVTNVTGTGYSADALVKTLPPGDSGSEEAGCTNQLPRKQTGATALPDCRAYELVSAGYTGGFDVESPTVPGEEPFAGYPSADGRVLYGVHAGVIPGPWNPTNRGIDPYVAVRGADGWTTEYVGLPAELSPDKSHFSSVLGGTDADLHTFAFAGPGICDPCFEEAPETGIPLREPNGHLGQGMVGSNPPAGPNMEPEGRVAKMVSANGEHLVFGSKEGLVPGADNSGANLNIFDRDLTTKSTQLVSTTTSGDAIQAGMGLSEVDLSEDGSRILIATKVSEDADGNEYVRLFMHLGASPDSVEVSEGASAGVLYDGMTADGSKVFFTSSQQLTGEDNDAAADVYEATVASDGNLKLRLLTPGTGAGCNPVANGAGAHWNAVGGTADCSAVAIGGSAGVATETGALYLLSPEQLVAGHGALNQPNLFIVPPGGSPEYVATLSPEDPLVVNSVHDAAAREGSEFEATPSGEFATFRSVATLTGVNNSGEPSVFRYQHGAAEPISCPSCNPTLTQDPTLKGEASLASDGLSITDDGRVFFNTSASLSVEDTGGRADIYEWVGGRARLISSGTSRFDSALLTVTHDGIDAFFFTHETFDPNVDLNGERTKIYDARTGGGLFTLPRSPGCAASDECHGPGTVAPPPPQIGSSGPTSQGNFTFRCRKGTVAKHGKCVKKPKHKKHRAKKHGKKGTKHHA